MKKIIAICLVILLSSALFSCGKCEAHVDGNLDYICDECGASLPKPPKEPVDPDDPQIPDAPVFGDIDLPEIGF